MDIGLEIIMINGKTVYFAFENQDRMEDVYRVLIGILPFKFIAKVTIEAETSLEKM
jgi:factor associated with neutral sphingomyelinase activation